MGIPLSHCRTTGQTEDPEDQAVANFPGLALKPVIVDVKTGSSIRKAAAHPKRNVGLPPTSGNVESTFSC